MKFAETAQDVMTNRQGDPYQFNYGIPRYTSTGALGPALPTILVSFPKNSHKFILTVV